MFRTSNRRLVAAASVVVLALTGLASSLFIPAHAATAQTSVSGTASPSEPGTTTEVIAYSVPETQEAVRGVLEANDASRAWPAVDADLTPKLHEAVAARGGDVLSEVFALPFKIVIKCTITYPPLQIKCDITIEF